MLGRARAQLHHVLHPQRRQVVEHQQLGGQGHLLHGLPSGLIRSLRLWVVHDGGARGGGLDVARRQGGRAREVAREGREVEHGARALDAERGGVVRARRHLRAREGAQPDARLLAGLPDLRHPLAPRAHADAAVRRGGGGGGVRARALLAAGGGRRGGGVGRVGELLVQATSCS
jgi:hypothetical protein